MNDHSPLPHVLGFNGQQYKLAEVLRLAGLGPHITIQESDLNKEALAVVHTGNLDGRADSHPVAVFYKHEGKYLVLAGHANYRKQLADPKYKGELKGRLISSPVLKKARLDNQAEAQPIQTHEPVRRSGWTDRDADAIRNRARIMDDNHRPRWGGAGRDR